MEALTEEADAAARRSLANRMERFLDGVDRAERRLTQWETNELCRVLALLQTGQYFIGKDVMRDVGQPDIYCTDNALAAVSDGPVLTVAEVRASLAGML